MSKATTKKPAKKAAPAKKTTAASAPAAKKKAVAPARKPSATAAKSAKAAAKKPAPKAVPAKKVVAAKPARLAAPVAAPAPKAKPAAVDPGLTSVLAALALALDKKALEPVLLDVRELCSYCNYQLVLSGRSERQVEAIADGLSTGLRDAGERSLGKEGTRSGQWALLDYGDFIVHIFLHAVRDHYDLEGLWSDAPRVAIDVPADARIGIDEAY